MFEGLDKPPAIVSPVSGYQRSGSDSDSDSSQGRAKKTEEKQLGKNLNLLSATFPNAPQEERIERIRQALKSGANINFQDANSYGNTPLHTAVREGEYEIVKFLLENGADPNIRNSDGKTPLMLASKRKHDGTFKKPEIYNLLISYQYKPPVQSLAQAGGSKMFPGTPSQGVLLSEPTEYIAGGSKYFLHGTIYQLQLLTLFMHRALDKQYSFHLATEMEAAEKFDDIVFRHEEDGRYHYRFLQAKHRQDENKQISLSDLTSNAEGDFSLLKYFSSYIKITKKDAFKGALKDFILCTNIDLDADGIKQSGLFDLSKITAADDFLEVKGSGKISHRYRLEIKKDTEFYRQFRKNPEERQLAGTLLDYISKGKPLDLKSGIFKQYHRWVAQEVIDVKSKKFRDDFVSEAGLSSSASAFRETFVEQALQHQAYRNVDEKGLWRQLETKLSLSRSFGRGSGEQRSLQSFIVEDSDINGFFKNFVLAVNQPSEVQLRDILAREVGQKSQFNLLDSDFVADYIQRRMLDWFKEKGGRFLSAEEGKAYFDSALTKINTILATGSSIEFCEKIAAYGICFSEESISQLEKVNIGKRSVLRTSSENLRVESIRLHQKLLEMQEFKAHDSFLFTPLTSLQQEATRQRLIQAFRSSTSHSLWVIECNKVVVGFTEKVYTELNKIIENSSNKKVIFIASETHPLVAGWKQGGFSFQTFLGSSSFGDLTLASQDMLLERTVHFQGSDIPLNQLITVGSSAAPYLPLADLIEKHPLKIGQPLSSEVVGSYLERSIAPTVIKNAIIKDQEAGKFTDFIAFDEPSFNELCQNNPGKTVHWLQPLKPGKLIWRQSQGELSRLRLYADSAAVITGETVRVSDWRQQIEPHQVILISGVAGMGKSTFLTHMAHVLKDAWPEYWIVKIDLGKHTAFTFTDLASTNGRSLESFLDLTFSNTLHSPFEREFFSEALFSPESSGVILMVDGVDEISPSNQEAVIKSLKAFSEGKIAQMWLTTRPHLQNLLEERFGQLSFSLAPLSLIEQINFLVGHWRAQIPLPQSADSRRLEIFAQALVTQFEESPSSSRSFLEIPLHVHMLAEIYCEESKVFLHGSAMGPTLSKKSTLLDVYEHFIKGLLTVFLRKGEANIRMQTEISNRDISLQKGHQKLAIELLFPQNKELFLEALSLNSNNPLPYDYLSGIGIVSFIDDKPVFSHRNYAEYFAAKSIIQSLLIRDPPCSPLAENFLFQIILNQDHHQMIRGFLDSYLSANRLPESTLQHYGDQIDNWDKTNKIKLHQAAQDGNAHIVDFLLGSLRQAHYINTLHALLFDQLEPFKDTPLHRAVEKGHVKTVEVLLKWAKVVPSPGSILMQENSQQQTILHLAVEEGRTEIAEQLLQWAHDNLSDEKFVDLLLHKNGEEQTALMIALLEKQRSVIHPLLRWYETAGIGVDRVMAECFSKQNVYSNTPYQLSLEQHAEEILDIPLKWVIEKFAAHREPEPLPRLQLDNHQSEEDQRNILELFHKTIADKHRTKTWLNTFLRKKMRSDRTGAKDALPELHRAVLEVNTEKIRQLLGDKEGVVLEAAFLTQDSLWGLTPLHLAAYNTKALLGQLLESGERLDHSGLERWLTVQDHLGQTPLHLAAMNNNEGALVLLEFAERNRVLPLLLQVKNCFAQLPIHVAAEYNMQGLALFLQYGQNLGLLEKQLLAQDLFSETPLHQAIADHQIEAIDQLLKSISDQERTVVRKALLSPNVSLQIPLHLAVSSGEEKIIDSLLHCAAGDGILEKMLFSQDAEGNTPLHLAVLEEQLDVVYKLLQHLPLYDKQAELLLSKNKEGNTPLHLAVIYQDPAVSSEQSLVMFLLKQIEHFTAESLSRLLLTRNYSGRMPLSQLLEGNVIASEVVESFLSLYKRLSLLEQQEALTNIAEQNLLAYHQSAGPAGLLNGWRLRVASELEAASREGLSDVLRQASLLLDRDACSSAPFRKKRSLGSCEETDREFPYEPLEEVAPREQIQAAHWYVQCSLILAKDTRHHQHQIDKLLHSQRALGDILSKEEVNRSPNERKMVSDYHQQASKFSLEYPQKAFFRRGHLLPPPPTEKQRVWLLENGRHSILLFLHNDRYSLYTPDLNYRHLLHFRPQTTLEEIKNFAQGFFKWRSGNIDYASWNLKKNLPHVELTDKQRFSLTSIISAKESLAASGNQLNGIPIQELKKITRINGQPIADEAWHPNFLEDQGKNIQLHVESLHRVLPHLNNEERQHLAQAVVRYDWSVDSSALHGLPSEQKRLLQDYQQCVMTGIKKGDPLIPEHLSELTLQVLKQDLLHYASDLLPSESRETLINVLWGEIQGKLQQLGILGKQVGPQALFFLPDFIRFSHTNDPQPLTHILGLMTGDHLATILLERLKIATVNHVHQNALLILKRLPFSSGLRLSAHAGNIAKMFRRIPIISPIFSGLTLYSIIDLRQKLSKLPRDSIQYEIVRSELALQSTALALIMSGPWIGAAANPLWLAFTLSSLMVAGDNLRKAEQLNVSIGKAVGFSLGFYSDELRAIYQGRDLVAINLAIADSLSTLLEPSFGWVMVKTPTLDTGEWRNVSIDQVPKSIQQAINNKGSKEPHPRVGALQSLEVGRFRQVNTFSTKNAAAMQPNTNNPSGRTLVRDKLLTTHWNQIFYQATPAFSKILFSNNSGYFSRDSIFLPSLPNPLENYQLENRIVSKNVPMSKEEHKYHCSQAGRAMLKSCNTDFLFNNAFISPPENVALYADNRTFPKPSAQRSVYFFFDPREGNSGVRFTTEGLKIWDQLNKQHNDSYATDQDVDYRLTVQVGHKNYSNSIIFQPLQESWLIVTDESRKISNHYLIQGSKAVPFKIIDDAAIVDITFLDNQTANTTISSHFLSSKEETLIKLTTPEKEPDSLTLSGNKTYLRLVLSDQHIIDDLSLSAQQVAVLNARGINSSSQLRMSCAVDAFAVTIRGAINLTECNSTIIFDGNPNSSAITYRKLFNSPTLNRYQLELPPENISLLPVLQTLERQSEGYFKFRIPGFYCFWISYDQTSGEKQLIIQGKFDGKNVTLTLQANRSTVVQWRSDALQPELVFVDHYIPQAHGISSLRLRRAASNLVLMKQYLERERDGTLLQGLRLLTTLPHQQRAEGIILQLQSPQGFPEFYRFPCCKNTVVLNGINYRAKDDKLYAIGATTGIITGEQLLHYDIPSNRPVDIYFSTMLNETKLSRDNGTLVVNDMQLSQLPGKTRLYFGPSGQEYMLPLKALQDTWLPPFKEPRAARQRRQLAAEHESVSSSAQRPTPWTTPLLKKVGHWLDIIHSRVHGYSGALFPAWEATISPFQKTVGHVRDSGSDVPTLDVLPNSSDNTWAGTISTNRPCDSLDFLNAQLMLMKAFRVDKLIATKLQECPPHEVGKPIPEELIEITEQNRTNWQKKLSKIENLLIAPSNQIGKTIDPTEKNAVRWFKYYLEDAQQKVEELGNKTSTTAKTVLILEETLQGLYQDLKERLLFNCKS